MDAHNLRLSAAKIFCWTARILGTLLVMLFLVFAIGEGLPRPSNLTRREMLMFAATGVMLLGLMVAWRWAAVGGTLALAGYLFLAILSGVRSVTMSPFAAGGVSGILHVAGWWLSGPRQRRLGPGPK
jgi:asparagine N-glycosylation enzyme membrane subunit Stt3